MKQLLVKEDDHVMIRVQYKTNIKSTHRNLYSEVYCLISRTFLFSSCVMSSACCFAPLYVAAVLYPVPTLDACALLI